MPAPRRISSADTPRPALQQTYDTAKSAYPIRFLDAAIFFFLCLFALLLPHSIKGAQHSWQIACLLWLLTLAVARRRPLAQPLSAPLLAYVTFSGISTVLSPDPYL